MATENSGLSVNIFRKGKIIYKHEISIGEEDCNIEYNQKFLDFCNFIEKDIVHGYGLKN